MQRVRLSLGRLRVDGGRLFTLRTAAGITQSTIAQRAQISDLWYRKIERHGQQPSLPVAQSIAEALGCDLHDFCTLTDGPVAGPAA